jgi:hypothetical protein
MFSATVRDENSAPSWNSMPKRRRSAFISSGLERQTSAPRSRIDPAAGRSRPITSFSSTDFPCRSRR